MFNMKTLQDVAQEALDTFSVQQRDDESLYSASNASPDSWIKDMIRKAHGDMMPDDFRYQVIGESLERFAESDDPNEDAVREIADDIDIYTSDLLEWLGSHTYRPGYVDEAIGENQIDNIIGAIGLGQERERYEIASSVLESLRNQLEEQ